MTDVAALVARGRLLDVRRVVRDLDDAGRKAGTAALTALVRDQPDLWWHQPNVVPLAMAVAGCAPSAAKASALLVRQSIRLDGAAARAFIEVADERGVTWLADLANRIAGRLSRTDPTRHFEFVAEVLAHEKAPPPTDDPFVICWVEHVNWSNPEMMRVDRLRADPFLDPLLPRLFEVDGAGNRIDGTTLRALAALAVEGRIRRTTLLDGCRGRMLRGDRPAALRAWATLHDLLTPTPSEVAGHVGDYLRLLADGPAPVATLAQKHLRGAASDLDGLLDASRDVLIRPEKALVRAQLGWLDRLAKRHPERAGEIADVIAVATTHPAVDLRERAAAFAVRHGRPIPATATTEPTAAGHVGSAAVGSVAATVRSRGDDLPPAPGPAPAPPPITDPDELAEETVALISTLDMFPAAVVLDRVLDAVVRFAGTDAGRAAGALAPVLARNRDGLVDHQWERGGCVHGMVGVALGVLVDPQPRRGRWNRLLNALRPTEPARAAAAGPARGAADPPGYPAAWPVPTLPAPHAVLLSRLAEIGERARSGAGTALLAAPTRANGAIDTQVLLDRLAALGDREPWPADLLQALLRLPAMVDEEAAGRAAALRTPAGDRLAAWLRRGGLPRPDHHPVTIGRPAAKWTGEHTWAPERRVVVSTTPPAGVGDVLGLLTRRAEHTIDTPGPNVLLWPSVLPGYLGLAAAWVMPEVAAAADLGERRGTAVLPLLAECTGDGGPAVDVALAYGIAARHKGDQVAAVDALLSLAASGRLDAAGVGTHVGELARHGVLTPSRCLVPLRDAAAAGARLTTWRILAAALPALLARPKPPPGTPDLLTVAAETAAATGVAIPVPGLAEVAARGGSTRLVTEARRLAAVL
jgi:hypothetical protein